MGRMSEDRRSKAEELWRLNRELADAARAKGSQTHGGVDFNSDRQRAAFLRLFEVTGWEDLV